MAISNGFSKGQALALFQRKSAELTAIAALSPSNGDFLKRSGGVWIAAVLAAGDIPDLSGTYALASHNHGAADVVSGMLDNARINWAAPGAIGGTTPNTAVFSRVWGIGTSSATFPVFRVQRPSNAQYLDMRFGDLGTG